MYYPPVRLEADGGGARLLAAARAAVDAVNETGAAVRLRPVFPAISDLSFLGGRDEPASIEAVAGNTPAWGSQIRFDAAEAARHAIPMVNAGPWGRDYHRRTERVHAGYAFSVLPELLWRLCGALLGPVT
jgi:arginine utilization protein RocB